MIFKVGCDVISNVITQHCIGHAIVLIRGEAWLLLKRKRT